MRPYRHPKDAPEFLLQRIVGKKKRKNWKLAAVAKAAPHELDKVKVLEADIHTQMEAEIEETGLPYISLREHLYGWLQGMGAAGHGTAFEILGILKDLPDLIVFDTEPGTTWSRCLMLELKRKTGSGRPGQKRLAEAAGGTIAKGYTAAHQAFTDFITRKAP
jgi:hypothetical protein